MLEVIDRSGDSRVAITAIGLANSLLLHDAQVLQDGLAHAAAAAGLKTYQGSIGVKADG